jgi:hypothetical protein
MADLIINLLERFGLWVIPILILAASFVWIVTHLNTEPGGKVSVFWKMIEYIKSKPQVENGRGSKQKETGRKSGRPAFKDKDIDIIFNLPKNGDTVPQFSDVEYELKGQLPKGYIPVLYIRDPLGQHWSWGVTYSGSRKRVQYGVLESSGEEFEVGILITNTETPFGQPMRILPKGIAYESVVVKRE